MTFVLEWGGRATDFAPELLQTQGKPGRVAGAAREAIWEALQHVAEQDPGVWARVQVSGWEEPGKPGLGQFIFTFKVLDTETP